MIATVQQRENVRRAQVERRWPRHQWDASGQSRWAGWDWRQYLYVVIFGLLLSGDLLLQAVLSKGGQDGPWGPFGLLAESSFGLTVLALLILANGWLVDRSLADRTPGESLVPAWLRWLRRAVVSVPVVGLYAIPVWRGIVQKRPAWAFRTSGLPAIDLAGAPETIDSPLSRFRDGCRRLRRHQGQSLPALFLWVVVGQIAPWFALLSWVTTPEVLSPSYQKMLLALSALCHVGACMVGLQYGMIRGRQMRAGRSKAAALRYAPLTFLFPFPVWIAGLLVWMAVAGEDVETFVGRSHSNRTRPPAHLPIESGSSISRLFRLLTRGRRELDVLLNDLLPGTLENSEIKSRQLAFCRLKAFLLLLDAAVLAWILAKLGGPALSVESTFKLYSFLLLPALGILIELSFLAMRVIGWFLRRGLPYHPYGRALTLTQLAMAAGLCFGPLLAAGNAVHTGLFLQMIGLGAAVASTMLLAPTTYLLMLPGRQTLVILAWVVLFFELVVTGIILQYHPELAPPFLNLFTIAILLTPLWNLALFLGLKSWILHPLELRHLFDQRLPGKARAVLASVVLTTALPLGGIAIPFWIYAHHRLWPKYEKLLWNLKGSEKVRPYIVHGHGRSPLLSSPHR